MIGCAVDTTAIDIDLAEPKQRTDDSMTTQNWLQPSDDFLHRHIGPTQADIQEMLATLGLQSLDTLSDTVIPSDIRLHQPLDIPAGEGEQAVLDRLKDLASQNKVYRSLIGMGYYDCVTPGVIQRNILENPAWYTQYTPYQAEISQGRLEALVNFQTMVTDLTGLPLANASLLDEATAAAEAMAMCYAIARNAGQERKEFFVSRDCHPQTLAVLQTRAEPLGIVIQTGILSSVDCSRPQLCGILLQYPATDGYVGDFSTLVTQAHEAGALVVVATDLLALTLLRSPGEFGADIVVGSTQRFGVPIGFGGPHAAFLATREEYKRQVPGRLVGVSKDVTGKPAIRLSLQTREQHIRREKATSNICTAQVLLAVMAAMFAVYHGPDGLRRIAERVRGLSLLLAEGLRRLGFEVSTKVFFDTIRVPVSEAQANQIAVRADEHGINFRHYEDGSIGISLDEVSSGQEVRHLLQIFVGQDQLPFRLSDLAATIDLRYPAPLERTSKYLTHEVFHRYHSEHEMLRYLHRLQSKDLSLVHSMIPLGSCTMKLNATAEMLPVTWPEFARLHPFAPVEQTLGYRTLFRQLEAWLAEIAGFAAFSLQPNAGSQGEYSGLMVIRAYHRATGATHRDVCLIPVSAHGTNPASAAMVGMTVVVVACDRHGNVDVADLEAKAAQYRDRLSALMLTYPSTHGVFEASVRRICQIVHTHGGQVYIDGANMNAMVGLCRLGDIGADVCHLNLHKTFCIPHGGGGPGVGPIGVAPHLVPFLPGHTVVKIGGPQAIGPVSAAPFGSPSILPISWVYIALMGRDGLTKATQVAILSANYMAKRLEKHYSILYKGDSGLVAHEFILDLREFKESAGVEAMDVAKRLMDYGFHAPTVSFPVAGTLMVEPTESEAKGELDRLCEALVLIRAEIQEIVDGRQPRTNNLLKNAPHTAAIVTATEWNRPYSREQAAFPAPWLKHSKFWPSVSRIDEAYGDRHLVCSCPPMETYQS
ncbi:MAG: aminomethyl-transferring glycine dehydrogenase [Nitrospira sp. BO4]|jgi:glycine dehydrogenase|nr:aminomethyl-transferring glycine dehydrogenase [Nitrospira sp. BO4]